MKKEFILRGRKNIEILFQSGKGFINYPLRCVYIYSVNNETPSIDIDIKTLFIVGKRYHKRAVKRNVVRRRIKEALRLELPAFEQQLRQMGVSTITIGLLYLGKQESNYSEIDSTVKKILNNVKDYIKKNSNLSADSIG